MSNANALLTQYFRDVSHHKLLTREQEVELAKRIEGGDSYARDTMIQSNLRLAISIAKKYSKSGCALEDLIQESNIGLMKAVEKFDWRKGFKFSTYACWWIKQSIHRFIEGQSTQLKFPSGSRHMIYQINKLRNEYEKQFGVFPDDKEIAELLRVSADSITSLRLGMQWPVNIDHPVGGEHGSRTYAEVIPDNSTSIDDVIDQRDVLELIKRGFALLTPQEERVIRLRFGISESDENTKQYPANKGVK